MVKDTMNSEFVKVLSQKNFTFAPDPQALMFLLKVYADIDLKISVKSIILLIVNQRMELGHER